MKILGVGIDLVENARMLKLIDKQNFLRKVLHSSEINRFNELQTEETRVQYLASRWAIKQAVTKAVGRTNLHFHEMLINKNAYGRPYLELSSEYNKSIFQELKIKEIHISITHEKNYSSGYAIAVESVV